MNSKIIIININCHKNHICYYIYYDLIIEFSLPRNVSQDLNFAFKCNETWKEQSIIPTEKTSMQHEFPCWSKWFMWSCSGAHFFPKTVDQEVLLD